MMLDAPIQGLDNLSAVHRPARPPVRNRGRSDHACCRALPAEGMSYEKFLDWCDEDTLAEWVDGEVIMASPDSADHQIPKALSALKELGVV